MRAEETSHSHHHGSNRSELTGKAQDDIERRAHEGERVGQAGRPNPPACTAAT